MGAATRMSVLVACLFFLIGNVHASVIAVIDSGFDVSHREIYPNVWRNPLENSRDGKDQDGNGYRDDIFGWNFVDNNSYLIDRSYINFLNDDIESFFDLRADFVLGEVSPEDMSWLEEKQRDSNFVKSAAFYASYMHGTHVGGIAVKGNPDARLLGIKYIPTGRPPTTGFDRVDEIKEAVASYVNLFNFNEGEERVVDEKKVDRIIQYVVNRNSNHLDRAVDYAASHEANVINMSFGVNYYFAMHIVSSLIETFFPSSKLPHQRVSYEDLEHYAASYIRKMNRRARRAFDAAPDSLFVISSGNDELCNDDFPAYPVGAGGDNVIVVAATFDNGVLAPFSNYGKETVDVAAPGVAIRSSVPGNNHLRVSGTSQSAPYVSNVAARIIDMNPYLTPEQVKRIIVDTVDMRSFLIGRVRSGGVVNKKRALRAAYLSNYMTLSAAISRAANDIRDYGVTKSRFNVPKASADIKTVVPLPVPFI